MAIQVEAIHHVCIVTTSIEIAAAFYRDVLGFPQDVERPHVFHAGNEVEVHACADPISSFDAEPNEVHALKAYLEQRPSGWADIPEPNVLFDTASLSRQLNHVAFLVADIQTVVTTLLHGKTAHPGITPFQMDENGARRVINSVDDDLSFGHQSIYVYDLEGNLVEFAQRGAGNL